MAVLFIEQGGTCGMTQSDLGQFGSTGNSAGDPESAADVAEAATVAGNGEGHVSDVVNVEDARFPDATGYVELAITQVDYTIEGSGRNEYPVIHVFGRTTDGTAEHVRVLGFEPYFYVPTETLDTDPVEGHDSIVDARETNSDGTHFESIRGERLTKVIARTPRDVGQIRDDFEHYEADILFPNRFLIDKGLGGGIRVPARYLEDGGPIQIPHEEAEPAEVDADIRVNMFDIEVDDRNGFPEDGEEPIVCLTSHDSVDDTYIGWLYEAPVGDGTAPDDLSAYEPLREGTDIEIRSFESEEAMLEGFLEYIETTDPDLLSGWNFEDFDAPYLLDRMELLNPRTDADLSIERLSRVDEVWRSGWGGPDIKGRVVFDLLYAYKRTQFTELESYRLDAVGELELDVGKERYSGDIGDLWENDPTRLLEYNVRDVELCVEIDHKQAIIPFWDEVRKFVGCKLEDAPTPGDAVDVYVLHKAHGKFALPTKGQQETEDFEGGAVFDPITGVRENVTVLDLKCFSGDTEVMTPAGPKDIRQLSVGDPVYTLNPDTFECEIKPIVETHQYPNKFGELHHLRGNTHDFKVTENHRFLVSNKRGWDSQTPEDFTFEAYRDIPSYERFAFPNHEPMDGAQPERFSLLDAVEDGSVVVYYEDDLRRFRSRVPEAVADELQLIHGSCDRLDIEERVGKYLIPVETYREHETTLKADGGTDAFLKYGPQHRETPLSFEMDDWLELVGWYVTEGSLDAKNGRVTLDQSNESGRAAIEALLDRMEINYNVDARGYNISNRYLIQWFEKECGRGSKQKHLPDWVFDLDGRLLETLLETMVAGDGSVTDSGLMTFWTASEELMEGFARVAVRCGHKPTVREEDDGTWYVSAGKQGSFKKATNEHVEEHDGDVYCVTAKDNHVVMAGRNGIFQWVGQSLYPMCMVTINAGPETKVEEDFDGETYRAPNGTRFRKQPDGIMREMVDELLTEREEKKSLRNEHDPGSEPYVQYDRQQGAVKVIMNCFTPDTDVLTPEGVRSITDLAVGDRVYSLDPDTMTMEVKPVTETHSYPEYRGDLVDMQTDGVDFRVTPNHRMLVRDADENTNTEDGWEFVEAGDLDADGHYELPQGWAYDEPIDPAKTLDLRELAEDTTAIARIETDGSGTVTAPAGAQTGEQRVNGVDRIDHVDRAAFVRLLGWYIAGGELSHAGTERYQITIAQDDRSKFEAAERVVDELVSDYYREDRVVRFSSERLYHVLEQVCGKSEEKTIPDVVFESPKRVRRAFLDALVAGAGQYLDDGRSVTYTTESEDLRDDVLRLCLTLGYTGQYTREGDVWRVRSNRSEKPTVRMDRDSSTTTATDGVYCVTVADNHTLLAGRNGTFQFVGQSLYGVTGWDRFRLYDKEGAAAVTATGREVINFTETAANELDYEVAYGDSVTGDRPVVVRDPDGMMQVKPIRELFAMATAEPAESDVVVTADGGVVSETQRGKHRRSLPGWEALSLADDGTPEWQPISQVIRHQTDTPVVRLQHKFGESETTTDHSYIVEEDGRYVESSPEDVTEPLRIPDVPAVETIETIDVYEVLSGYTRAYADGRSVGTANAETKVNRVHADDDRVWFGRAHHGALDTKVTVQRYIDLNSEDGKALVRLLAAYVTEGSASTIETTDTKFGVSISESRRSWLEQLQSDYQRLFEGAETSIIASDSKTERTVEWNDGEASTTYNDETLKLQMMNELSAVFFREFAGQTSRGKRLPDCVYHLPEELQALFITTAVEGDGSRKFPRYSEEYCEQNFDFETTSRELAAGLSMLLTQRGQKHSLKYRSEKESYTIRTCDFYRSGRDPVVEQVEHDGYVYDLSVETNQNFVDGIGGIVLHNTDSVMLELGRDVEKSEAIDQSFEIEEYINERYDDFAREELNAEVHRFQIEFEKLYRRFFQAGRKKRYAGHIIWKEGKDVDDIDITGFEYKRSDIAQITKEVQLSVIETIVTGDDIEADLEEVKTYLNEIITGFLEGERSLEEIGIPGGIGKRLSNYDTDTAQVRGAKYANHMLGTNFDRGSKPKRLYLKKVHPDFWQRMENERGLDPQTDPLYGEFKRNPDVICFEYADQVPDEFEIDWEKMLEKTLKGPIERVIEALGMSWDEVKSGQEQTGLGSFM